MQSRKTGGTVYKVADGWVKKGQMVFMFKPTAGIPIPKIFKGPTKVQRCPDSWALRKRNDGGQWYTDLGSDRPLSSRFINWESLTGCLVSRPQLHPDDYVNECAALPADVYKSFDRCCKDYDIDPKMARLYASHGVKVGIGIGRRR